MRKRDSANYKSMVARNQYYKDSYADRRALSMKRNAAVNMVQKAIASGELSRSNCMVCGKEGAEAHHEDYDKPLDVVWLCRKHHSARHVEIRSQYGGHMHPSRPAHEGYQHCAGELSRSIAIARTIKEQVGRESGMQTLTLGKLIALLEQEPQDNTVQFDFSGFVPSTVDSYRGYYNHLALGYDANSGGRSSTSEVTVAELIARLKDANGKIFTGYKGGEYKMELRTPIWMANYGTAPSTAITGLAPCRYMTVLTTAFVD